MRTAAADWRALGTTVRLVVTDPALLDSCNLLLTRHLAEVDAACSRFRDDSELTSLDTAAGRPTRVSPLLAEALAVALRPTSSWTGSRWRPRRSARRRRVSRSRTAPPGWRPRSPSATTRCP
ncbi:hypothetical protein ACFWIO_11030 [Streptomyces diastatochromogenes]|uniref:hypothetical protein n=1 Tax=Streptomyces diastatochromogenes TaxID=42236 RepID=UPI003650A9B9